MGLEGAMVAVVGDYGIEWRGGEGGESSSNC